MYYWTKVDQGDRNEVVKILSFAKQNFNRENELFEIVNCTNSDGFTPLHLASSEGHAQLIEILIKFRWSYLLLQYKKLFHKWFMRSQQKKIESKFSPQKLINLIGINDEIIDIDYLNQILVNFV
jgi:ankyrin repeat protein